jgi:hypothetical protein
LIVTPHAGETMWLGAEPEDSDHRGVRKLMNQHADEQDRNQAAA